MSRNFKLALGLSTALLASPVGAFEGSATTNGVAQLDHVYLVMMENHGFSQIIGNPNAPFTNQLAGQGNLALNYFGIGHPSLTNYLEIVGGSNFGVRADNPPDWHNQFCSPNLATGVANTDNPATGKVCPIAGAGTDAATPAVDCTNEYSAPSCGNDIDGVKFYPADNKIEARTIADQLKTAGMTIKDYQESLPLGSPDGVNYSDGEYTNLTDFAKITPALNPPLTNSQIVQLYAAKHNPFAYFASVQTGRGSPSYSNMVAFDGYNGLWADLAAGKSPTFSYIVPNQCNDDHGRGNGTPFCGYDPNDNGTQTGLNPALIQLGDLALKKIVTAIKASPQWSQGRNAIFVVWDENDYSNQPNINKVAMIVDANFGPHAVRSRVYYNQFSLLKTLEGALDLPCLNHACDAATAAMTDLIGQNP